MGKQRKRGRPPKKMPKRIDAPPEMVAAALFAPNDQKVKKRAKQS
ncbi:MAG: hypothetical protein OXG05_14620 [Gammaproteobacteria bacterium]|nr:hypothetical protein [Gammaproteobacteria bacterium]